METIEIKAIEACQAGQLDKFGLLYDKYIKKIYDFVFYRTGHKETAEDIVSHVFLKAIGKIGGFQMGEGTFQAWLYRIARNAVIDHYRTAKQHDNLDDHAGLAGSGDADGEIDAREKLKEIRNYLAKLSPEQRDIITMRVWQEMSYAEIAEIMGKSEASCKMMYSRTITKLREEVPLIILVLFLLQN